MIDIKRGRYIEPIVKAWLSDVKGFFENSHLCYIVEHGKRHYFNSYAEKLEYECRKKVSQEIKDMRLQNAYIAKLGYWWKHIDSIILAKPDILASYIQKWDKKQCGSIVLMRILEPILTSYYDKVSSEYGLSFVDRLNIKTCPYCNRQFIHTIKSIRQERPELDHFYPKSKYPLFCLSFYNLIPACHSCNHIKTKDNIGVNPYYRAFGGKFVITDKSGNKLTKSQIYRLTEKEIRLDFAQSDIFEDKNVEVLGLKDVYNKHTDYIKELIDKSMAYDAHARRALVESFQGVGYSQRQVYDFVWGRHLRDAEFEDRPLSKLTKDILDLLDIHRG